MPLSSDIVKQLAIALTSADSANDMADVINESQAVSALSAPARVIAAAIVATATSTTTDFGELVVGDLVGILPATAGNAQFVTVAVAGTLPQAAVVGSLYLALRVPAAAAAVPASNVKF